MRFVWMMAAFVLGLAASLVVLGDEPVQKATPVQAEPVQKEPVQKAEPVQKEWQPLPVQKRLHELHQHHRDNRGIFRQRLDRRLCDLAQAWAEQMASRQRLYHSAMSYRENVAYGYSMPETTMNVWLNSSGHYANLMSGHGHVGFGAAQSQSGTWFWCSLHGNEVSESEFATSYAVCQSGACDTGGNGRGVRRIGWRPRGRLRG